MPFVKVVKNSVYFKRYQVKFRRRRQGLTDYRARSRLVCQDKNKYNAPKYRFVVRFTNTQVICQIIFSRITGDKVLASAYSSELPRYGLPVGLKNFPASYCTGLLLARRLLHSIHLDQVYKGDEAVSGEVHATKDEKKKKTYYVSALNDKSRPFRAFLDIGIRAATTGNRVFACLKGASDGGLDIPHSNTRFAGYNKETSKYDAKVNRGRIFGHHVANYLKERAGEEDGEDDHQMTNYAKHNITAASIEGMYKAVHKAIRADPSKHESKEFTAAEKAESCKHRRAQKLTQQARKDANEKRKKTLIAAKKRREAAAMQEA